MKLALSKETITESDDSSDEYSNSGESIIEPSKSTSQKTSSKLKKPDSRCAEPSSESSEESSGSESEPSAEEIQEIEKPSKSTKKRVTISENHSTEPLVSAKPYHPPEGFQSIQKSSSLPLELKNALSDLNGKQLWHITAPAAVPFSSIKELVLDSVATGNSIFTHKGVDYRLREDLIGADRNKNLLVPDKSGSTYRRHQVDIVQTFHLEQIVNTPSQGPASQIEALIKKAKPLPSQPKNLRMRYTPFGSAPSQGKDSQGADDSDTEITFKDPMDVDQDRETKKQKKKRKHPDVDGPSVSQNAAGTESQSQVSIPRKKSKKAHTHEDATKQDSGEKGETQKQSTKHREMTSPDRRAKKEEKKRKKAEKDRAT